VGLIYFIEKIIW